MMRSTLLAALVSAAIPMTALAQTADELKNDDKTPGDVLTYGMGYSQHRFSPLTQINRQTVKRLVLAWSYSMADNRGLEGQALVKDGVVFLTEDGGGRRADRPGNLEDHGRISAGDDARRLLRHRQSRRGAVRWQALSHNA